MNPPIIPLTSDTPRLHHPVSRSRRHANALSTKAVQIPMALGHHERRVATRSAHTRVSYETSKNLASSLRDERFVADFLQKSRVKSPKRAFRTRLPQKLACQSLQSERFLRDFLQNSSGNTHRSTHITALPSRFAIIPPPPNNTRSHANPNVTATFTSTTTHPCACHASFRVPMSNARKVLRLP